MFGRKLTVTDVVVIGIVGYLGYKAYMGNEFGIADLIEANLPGVDPVAGNGATIDDVSNVPSNLGRPDLRADIRADIRADVPTNYGLPGIPGLPTTSPPIYVSGGQF